MLFFHNIFDNVDLNYYHIIFRRIFSFQVTGYLSIFDMRRETDCLNHYNQLSHFLDFEKLFLKIVRAILVFEIL